MKELDWIKDLKVGDEDIVISGWNLTRHNELAVDSSKEISRQKFYEEVLRRFNEAKNDR